MSRRRLALIAGTAVLLGTVFTVAFMNPQVFSLVGGPAQSEPAETVLVAEEHLMPTLTPEALKAKLDGGERVILADVRGPSSFKTRHIAGALSMPASEMERWGPQLSREDLLVFYCSCPDDHSSTSTATLVREKYGLANLAVLEGGLRAWEKAGYPMTFEDAGAH